MTRMYYRPPKPKKYEHRKFYPQENTLVHFGSPEGTTYLPKEDDEH